MSLLTIAQRVALDWHLTEYDKSLAFDCLCDQLTNPKNYEEPPVVWQMFEGTEPSELIEFIETLAAEIQGAINESCKSEV